MTNSCVDQCPLCGNTDFEIFLDRRGVPVHQNLLMRNREAARKILRGDLRMAVCPRCGFVWNQAFDVAKLAYGEDYDNTQELSPFFASYLKSLAGYLVEDCGVRHSRIVEVGCGKGGFIRSLVEYPASGNVGRGYDPSYLGPAETCDGRLVFEQRYYGADCVSVPADVVVCRHVIEHVTDPLAMLYSVRAALTEHASARVYFETPCVDWILENGVFWDFFYEHCSLFNASSLAYAFRKAGFEVKAVRHVFRGQYLWLEAGLCSEKEVVSPNAGLTIDLARSFNKEEQRYRDQWLARVRALATGGRVALWGAGAKGVSFANLIDPDCELIDCVVDVNPAKTGNYLPGTGHPIVNYADLAPRGITDVINMNPNYLEENKAILAQLGIRANLMDV